MLDAAAPAVAVNSWSKMEEPREKRVAHSSWYSGHFIIAQPHFGEPEPVSSYIGPEDGCSRQNGISSSPPHPSSASLVAAASHEAGSSPLSSPSDMSSSSSQEPSPERNPNEASPTSGVSEVDLLRKLEEANRLLEEDKKSLQSLSVHSKGSNHSGMSGHSRKASGSSIISNTSVCSNLSNLQYDEESSLEDLWSLWGKLATDWDNISRKKPQFIKDLVRKGIPHHFRGIAWQLLCNSHHCPQSKEQYAEYLKQTSPFEKVIRRDITRTYPEHDFFKEKNGLGQESLFNVMKAYSLHDREVGYCQGSGFLVGLLLMNMPEEEAFCVLVQLMQEYRLRELYKPSMAELGVLMFQLECMMQEQMPELYNHFQLQNFCVSMFASSWFLTLFTTALPLPVACRIFDVFLSEGMEMIFRVGFAILYHAQDELMTLDMEGMLRYFQKKMPPRYEADPDILMNAAYSMKYSARKMKKLEKEYNALKTREQEDQVELRRLRTENRLLRQRIDNLEKETATLADRLIQDQVIRAQKEEEVFVLRRELSTLKQEHVEATSRLAPLEEELRGFKERESAAKLSSNQLYEIQKSDKEVIQTLEQQVASLKKDEVESSSANKQLRDKISELESANRHLQRDPSLEVQQLQEELIACKLREAEATLGMKELLQRVTDLEKYWQKQLEKWNSPGEGQAAKPSKDKLRQLQEEVMHVRLREAHAFAELQEMKQKVMELETQNQICNRQIKRQDDEMSRLHEQIEKKEEEAKESTRHVTELTRNISDLESKRKEDTMMTRIKDAEHSQSIAEMRQRIAELEIENQELVTASQLQREEKGETQELENRIADLQEEPKLENYRVMQLKMTRKLQTISSLALSHINADTESEGDTDDLDTTVTDSQKLRPRPPVGEEFAASLAEVEMEKLRQSSLTDSMACSLTEADIDKLRLKYPMSDSMMMSLTEADIEKLKFNPMTDSMICEGNNLVDVRKTLPPDGDADGESSGGEGLYDHEDGTVRRKTVSKKKRKSANKSRDCDANGEQSHVGGVIVVPDAEDSSSPEWCSETSTKCEQSKPDLLAGVHVDAPPITSTSISQESKVEQSFTNTTQTPLVQINGAVCNGSGSQD